MKLKTLLLFTILFTGCSNELSEQNRYALIISKDNQIVQETYSNGKGQADLINVQSITKSIISLLVGIAIEKGHLANEDAPIVDYFPEVADLFSSDKNSITIKHLLNHTSGLDWNGYLEHDAFQKSEAPINYVLQKKMIHQPGEKYAYNSGGTHLLSAILTRATGKSTLAFANEVLFEPLHFGEISWSKLKDGIYDGAGFGLSLQAKDLIKIGQLFLSNGAANGTQLIPSQWIGKSFATSEKMETRWGIRKSKHGYGWYSAKYGSDEILYSMGYGGQFIFILPAKNMVIISTHNSDTPNGIEQQVDFISETLPEVLEAYGG